MRSRHRAVIFDLDGLVIDSERVMVDAFIEVMATAGATVTVDDIAHLFGSTDNDEEWARIITSRCDLTVDEVVAPMTAVVRRRVPQRRPVAPVRARHARARRRGRRGVGVSGARSRD